MTIKILGTGCKNCEILYENVKKALTEMGINADVSKVTDISEIVGYGVMSTPALVKDEKVISSGKVLKSEDIKKLIIN